MAACQRTLPIQGTSARFQSELPIVRPQAILIDFSIRYDSLFHYLKFTPGYLLYDSQRQSGIDFPLTLALLQKPVVKVNSTGLIGLQFPLKVDAKPNIAGINTGLIQAKTNLFLDFQWKWDDINHRSIEQLRLNYQWLAKPEMRVLGFPIQVHGIIDPLIQRQLPSLQERINKQFNEVFSVNSLNSIINQVKMNYPSSIGDIFMHPADVDLKDVQLTPQGIGGKLVVRTALYIGDGLTSNPNRWVELQSGGKNLPFQVYFSYAQLQKQLTKSLQIGESQLELYGDSLGLHVQLKGYGRKNVEANLLLVPTLLTANRLGINLNQTRISGVGFMFQGYFRRKVERAIQSYTWSSSEALGLINQNTWGLRLDNGEIKLTNVVFTSKGIGVSGEIRGDWELKK